ncbi:protein-export chaperone SecB [Riemerella anatipestifer]|uniref:hypothetical protein n=1 Tax=Riemerella anatipestifer TaxID=34085 RepID=UPI002A8EF458|nr:protein-export chaperone SecB [Riemerella anatipestifer]
MENKAVFSLEKYLFSKVNINIDNKKSTDLGISFDPFGTFFSETSTYELRFVFNALTDGSDVPFVSIECIANFKFENISGFDDIPTYFYRNAIAIIFPYIRAFISTVTLQSNIPPIVLPTMNLSSLEKPLKDNTIKK